jgi:hypothetical protein
LTKDYVCEDSEAEAPGKTVEVHELLNVCFSRPGKYQWAFKDK